MYFKVLMEMGHLGSRKSYEITRYFEAEDAMSLLSKLDDFPGMKSKKIGSAIKLIQPISREVFEKGKAEQKDDPYYTRLDARYGIGESAQLSPFSCSSIKVSVTATDYSRGGIGIICEGEALKEGDLYSVSIESMNILKRKAVVYWSRIEDDGAVFAGLKWV